MHKDRKRGQNSLTEVVKAPEPSKSCAQPVNSIQQSSASSPLRFSEFSIDELLVVEICAGSARLTKTCRKIGLRGLAVDRSKERSCGTDILALDLTVDSQLQLLLDVLGAKKTNCYWFSSPLHVIPQVELVDGPSSLLCCVVARHHSLCELMTSLMV